MVSTVNIRINCQNAMELNEDEKVRLAAMFRANSFSIDPSGFGPRDFVAYAEYKGDVVGFRRFKQHRFSNRSGESHECFQCCDTITDKLARGQRISTRLVDAFKEIARDSSFLFNFPNDMSLPVYRKMGFKIIDYNLTGLHRGPVENRVPDDVLCDDRVSDDGALYQYKLREGLLSKIPFFAFGHIGQQKPRRTPSRYFLNLSTRHMWENNRIVTVKSPLSLLRPVTFYPLDDIDPAKINATATSFDTLK